MKKNPSLDDLSLFIAVANTNSFSQAAEHLDIPVATLSRRITLLEKEINMTLLQRNTRHVGLTPAGEDFYIQLIPALDAVKLAVSNLSDKSAELHGAIRLSCAEDFATHCLATPLAQFAQTNPKVTINLELSSHYIDLVASRVDLAIRIGHLADSALYARHLFDMPLKLYATPSYLACIKSIKHPNDLKLCNFIQLKTNKHKPYLNLIHQGSAENYHIEGNLTANSMSMIVSLCQANAGIALIPELFIQNQLEAKILVPVLPEWSTPSSPIHIVTAAKKLPTRVQLLIEHLQNSLTGLTPIAKPHTNKS